MDKHIDYPYICPTCKHSPRGYGDGSPCEWCGHNENYEPKEEGDSDEAYYERAIEQLEHDILYEPTYNVEDGSM